MMRTRTRSVVFGALFSMVGAGCMMDTTERGAADEPEAPGALQSGPERPDGWSDLSHGQRDDADYGRVFADDRVQRIDLVIAPEVYERQLEDLRQRLGGGRGGSPAAVAACADLTPDAPCKFLELEGRCAQSRGGGALTCRAEEQGAGALDMVPGDPVFVPVTVRYDGRVWDHVGMRYKGNSSLTGPFRSGTRKLGMRLDFDRFEDEHPELKNQRFFGFDKLTFSSGYSDSSLIREKLTSDLLRDAGLVVARTAFYRLFVDSGSGPEYWGLYTMVEDPADKLADAQFEDGSGNMYKPDGVGADFTRFDPRGFDKKSNEDEADYGDVQRAIAALHAPRTDAAAWRAGLEKVFDVETFLHNLAISRAIDGWDGYGQMSHNYYLYGDPSQGGRLVWISWDHNMTWPSARGRTAVVPDNISTRWPLINFLIRDPVYRARYFELLEEFAATLYEKSSFDARATALHTMIAPYVVGAEGERAPYTFLRSPESFQNGLTTLLSYADTRRAAITQALEREAAAIAAAAAPAAPAAPASEAQQ